MSKYKIKSTKYLVLILTYIYQQNITKLIESRTNMHPFKHFLHNQRKSELVVPYIILNENISLKLYGFFSKLDTISFTPGEYQNYMGETKVTVDNFIHYWTSVVNECVKANDRLLNTIHSPEQVLELIESSIKTQHHKQENLKVAFIPENNDEQDILFELEAMYQQHIQDLNMLKVVVGKIDTTHKLKEFCEFHFELSTKKKNESFWCAHASIAMKLSENMLLEEHRYFKVMEKLHEYPDRFSTVYKMSLKCYNIILSKVKHGLQKQHTHWREPVCPEERLLYVIWALQSTRYFLTHARKKEGSKRGRGRLRISYFSQIKKKLDVMSYKAAKEKPLDRPLWRNLTATPTRALLLKWKKKKISNNMNKIRASLEDIINRVRTNLRNLKETRAEQHNQLLQDLFDANKDLVRVSRRAGADGRDTEIAEIQVVKEKTLKKIENVGSELPLKHLEEELQYWNKKLADFREISSVHHETKQELDKVMTYKKTYETMIAEKPEEIMNKKCYLEFRKMLRRRIRYLENRLAEVSRSIMTFFSVRGMDRVQCYDSLGSYYIDEYGHQIYVDEHGILDFHIDCEGKRYVAKGEDRYYYDAAGRYIEGTDNEKIYQCGPCTSTYKLCEDELLHKTTIDCGHSDNLRPQCKMQTFDPNRLKQVIPNVEPTEIKDKITAEQANYLWDTFGIILSEAVMDLWNTKTKDPLSFLGHSLLKLRHLKYVSKEALREKAAEGAAYRSNIYREAGEKCLVQNKESEKNKSKRVQPEISYDDDAALKTYVNSLKQETFAPDTDLGDYYYLFARKSQQVKAPSTIFSTQKIYAGLDKDIFIQESKNEV